LALVKLNEKNAFIKKENPLVENKLYYFFKYNNIIQKELKEKK